MARWVFLCALLFFLLFAHGHFMGSDEQSVYETTRAMFEKGDLVVPENIHVFAGRGGHLYSHFAVGQSLAALPLYAGGKLAAAFLPDSWIRSVGMFKRKLKGASGTPEIFAVSLYSQLVSALLITVFFLLQRRLGVSLASALLCSALLACTTYVAGMSVYFLRHTTEATAILGALLFFHAYGARGRAPVPGSTDRSDLRALALGSTLASSLILIRIPATLAGLSLGGYLLWVLFVRERDRRLGERTSPSALRLVLAIALPFAAVVAVHFFFNLAKWETWLTSPMLSQGSFFVTPLHVGVAGFLLSPGVSIFAYSPLLMLAPWTLAVFWRRSPAECATAVAMSLSFLLVCATFKLWTGLWSCPGPRYLFVVTPLFMLALGFWLDANRSSTARWRVAAIAVLALLGGVVNFFLMTSRWFTVIISQHLLDWGPSLGFIWTLDQSPIVGSALGVASGKVDNWLWMLAKGWPGQDAQPLAAGCLIALWLVCVVACGRGLASSVRTHPERIHSMG